jgi:type IV pilus assembly protein PilO
MNASLDQLLNRPLYQRILILVLCCAVLIAGFWFLVHQPQREEYDQLKNQKSSLESKLQQDRRIADNLPKFRSEYEKLKQQLERALRELPDKKEIPSLLVSISSLAKNNGLEVVEFKPDNERPKDFYAEVPVSLKLRGAYHDMAMFCYHVGNMSRIVNIGNLKMKGAKMEGGRNLLSINCLATTFRFIERASSSEKKGKKK